MTAPAGERCPFLCCACGRPGTHVHLLPHVHLGRPPERAVFACRDCDPGGLWLPLDGWLGGPPDLRYVPDDGLEVGYSLRDHYLESKVHGRVAVALVDALIADGLDRKVAA